MNHSIIEDDQYENLNDPLNLNKNNIFVVDDSDDENIGDKNSKSYLEDEHSNIDTKNNEEAKNFAFDDENSRKDNRTENMSTKLKVLRRKLSHLNMNPSMS